MHTKLLNFIKDLSADVVHDSSSAPDLKEEILKLVTLFVTDRILFPGDYAGKMYAAPGYREILHRNQPLLNEFPAFMGDVDWDCFRVGTVQQLNHLLEQFESREILHLPGMVHESLLTMSHQHSRAPANISRRKHQGSYYTPVHLVRYMVRNALDYFTTSNKLHQLKIIDPACGGGSFLVEMWLALTDMGISETEAAAGIFGLDIDETAVRLSIYLMTVAVWAKSACQMDLPAIKKHWEGRLINGNSLTHLNNKMIEPQSSLPLAVDWAAAFPEVFAGKHGDEPGFDLVIGNPPYVSNKLICLQEKKYYYHHYASAKGQFDLSVPFIEQGLNLLKTRGILSYITSNKFLAADYGKDIRKWLLERYQIREIVDVSMLNSFADTAAYPVIITVCKHEPVSGGTVKLSMVNDWRQAEYPQQITVEQGYFLAGRDYLISTKLDSSILPVLQRLAAFERAIPQKKFKCGLAMTGYNKWIVKNPHSDKNLLRFIQAGHIQPFGVAEPDFIESGHFSEAKAEEFKGSKLLIPGIATTLKAAVDYSDSILGRVYYIKQDEINIDLHILAVLMNSQVLNFYYKVTYWAVHLAGGYLRFNSGYLANLPMPVTAAKPGDWDRWDREEPAGQIGRLGLILSGLEPTLEPLETIRCRAEALVFSWYGLNQEEAEIIMQFNGLDKAKREKIKEILEEVQQWRKKHLRAN